MSSPARPSPPGPEVAVPAAAPDGAAYGPRSGWRRWLHTPAGQRARRIQRFLEAPREHFARRRAARDYLARLAPALRLAPEGWVRFEPGALPGSELLLAAADRVLERARPALARAHAERAGPRRLTIDLFGDELLARSPELVDVVVGDGWLAPVVDYLGTVPFLARLTLAHSAGDPVLPEPRWHQRFHRDNDDLRHVKLYVHVHAVGEDGGPLCFLPAPASARVLAALAREGLRTDANATYSDEEVFRHARREELVVVTGARGAGAFVDLSRCLHFGSRLAPGRDRTVIVAEYLRYHRLHENASNQLDPPRADHDRVRRMALTPPVRRPRGFFLRDPIAALDG
jgi:hypothetical protein